MAVPIKIADGKGRGYTAEVDKEHSLHMAIHEEPPLERQRMKPLRQYFTVEGTPGGDNDMGIDGSSTNVDFCVPADTENDRYISAMNFLVAYGTTGSPYQWGDGSELTNGTRVFYNSPKGDIDIHDAIKRNQDLFRLSFNAFPTAWEVRNVDANNDFGYFITMDLKSFGFPFGIKLDRGSKQKLTIRIRDNVGAAADTFNCIAYGFERFE